MPGSWDMDKCKWGVPENFTDNDAANAVKNADFTNAIFVNISEKQQLTKQAYTYYVIGGYRITVVAHVHREALDKPWNIAGNSFIPGWTGWEMATPDQQVAVVAALNPKGSFPGDDRFPHPVALEQSERAVAANRVRV